MDNRIFADCFNYMLHDGEAVIDAENLSELDTKEVHVLFDGVEYGDNKRNKAAEPLRTLERNRDIYKFFSAFTDGEVVYMMLGIEIQNKVDYAMPVRNMLYDALGYTGQIKNTAKKHRDGKDAGGHNSGEFLSGFYKDDRLVPVITLVIYLNPDEWDGPRELYDMFGPYDKKLEPFIKNYGINLIAPAELTDDDLGKFNTELGKVLEFIKCSGSIAKLNEMTGKYNGQLALSNEAVLFLNEVTHSKLKIDADKGETSMCKALDDMCADAKAEGRTEGEGLICRLLSSLMKDGRLEEMKLAVEDAEMRKKLYSEYEIVLE